MTTVSNPILRYYGGKWSLAKWIISHFPKHEVYIEPFCGAASVLLQKRPCQIETINDLDGRLVNFFRVVRDRYDELIHLIEYTPYAKAEWQLAQIISDDPLEDARRLFTLSWQSMAYPEDNPHWRRQKNIESRKFGKYTSAKNSAMEALIYVRERLKHVQIDNDDALAIIERYDNSDALFYVDPPYVTSTRDSQTRYNHEMSDQDHIELAKTLNAIKGRAIVSGYHTALYDELYKGWTLVTKEAQTMGETSRTECLWLSPNIQQSQLKLF